MSGSGILPTSPVPHPDVLFSCSPEPPSPTSTGTRPLQLSLPSIVHKSQHPSFYYTTSNLDTTVRKQCCIIPVHLLSDKTYSKKSFQILPQHSQVSTFASGVYRGITVRSLLWETVHCPRNPLPFSSSAGSEIPGQAKKRYSGIISGGSSNQTQQRCQFPTSSPPSTQPPSQAAVTKDYSPQVFLVSTLDSSDPDQAPGVQQCGT